MMKKHIVPLTRGGHTAVHQGKGSQMAAMPDRAQVSQLARGPGSINDYAKASPAAQTAPVPSAPTGSFDLGE